MLEDAPSLLMVGCGNMAGAMLAGWLDAGLDHRRVTVVRPSGQAPHPEVRTLQQLPERVAANVVLLGVKPQKLGEIAPALAPLVGREAVLVSILAGVELATLRSHFPDAGAIVRAMPNLPVRLRKGVIPLVAAGGADAALARVVPLMAALGDARPFADEAAFALAGHVAGAAPAFLFRFIDTLAEAGAALGLEREESLRLATRMAEGAAMLAAASPAAPAELARQVASPGGTTEAGLAVLDEGGALADLLLRTLAASKQRGEALAAAARSL